MLNPNSTFFVGPWTEESTFSAMNIGELAFIQADEAGATILDVGATKTLQNLDDGTPPTFAGFQIVQKIEPGPKSDPAWTVPGSIRYSPWLWGAGTFKGAPKAGVEGQVREGTYTRADFAAITQQSVSIACPAAVSDTTTFVLTCIFKDIRDLSPSVKYQSFYYTAKDNTETNVTIAKGLAAAINRPRTKLDNIVLVTAIDDNAGLLTINAVPSTYNMNQRYEFTLVNFEVGFGKTVPGTHLDGRIIEAVSQSSINVVSTAGYGKGNYQIVADMEKRAQARMGITNWVHFPVILPRMYTVESKKYTTFEFEFNKKYRSADNIVDVQTAENFILCVDDTTPTGATEHGFLKTNLDFALTGKRV